MKRMSLLLLLGISLVLIQAQEIVEKKASTEGIRKIEVEGPFAELIEINQGQGREVRAVAEYEFKDNDARNEFVFEFERKGDVLVCRATLESLDKNKAGEDTEPRAKKKSESKKGNDTECHVELKLNLKVWLPEGIELEVKTISGDLQVACTNLPLEIESISGDIDLTIPREANADLECHSISGRVFADPAFNIIVDESEDPSFLPFANISAILNKGGKEIELKTISGNIYIRKL